MNRALGAALAALLLVSCRQQVEAPAVANNAQAEAPSFGNVVLGNMELPAHGPPISRRSPGASSTMPIC